VREIHKLLGVLVTWTPHIHGNRDELRSRIRCPLRCQIICP
jgi:hypothetical protein